MADYITASRTKDYYAEQLFEAHPEIVSISPQLQFDDSGRSTGEAVIVVGVRVSNPLHDQAGAETVGARSPIPRTLSSISADGTPSALADVPVIVEYEGDIDFEMNTGKRRPCPGGFSIGHPMVTAGTLGTVVRVNGVWGFILSNNHVLANNNAARVGDPIWQPGRADGGGPACQIGTLNRWVPIDFSGGDNEVDCALAQANAPWQNNVSRNIQGIGVPTDLAEATVGQEIRKSGRTTMLTTGTIVSDNCSITLRNGARFVNQLRYSRMTMGGDSGSLILDRNSLTAVGLHFAGSPSASYGNKISRVLQLISDAFTVYNFQGTSTSFDRVTVELFD